jgi:hypothetical protein
MAQRGRLPLSLGLLLLAGPLAAGTHQDFDNPGAPYLLCPHVAGGALPLVLRDPAATDYSGRFLRLATGLPVNHSSAVFEIEDPGACRRDLDLEFDFRVTPQTGRADGIGVTLLRRSVYGAAKCVAPEDPLGVAEEPNFRESLGLGFDVHKAQEGHDDNDNHVSVHYNSAEIGEFDAGAVNMASSDWVHARVIIRGEGANSRLTVILQPKGPPAAPARTVVDNFLLSGFQLYPWRLRLGARSGGLTAFHDIDNVHVVASGCPELDGRWDPAPLTFPSPADNTLAIHSHQLPTGKVMFWDRHDYTPPGEHMPRLWDPLTGELDMAPHPGFDAFCSGHAFRADGRLFVAGGHIVDGNGTKTAASYDAITNTWQRHPDMTNGRWYPTVTTLADGSLLTVSGSYFDTPGHQVMNDLPEVFDPLTEAWRPLTTARRIQPYYPFMFLAPNGRVIDAGPQAVTRYLDTTGTGAWSFVAISHHGHRDYGSAAMYRPGKVVLLGGSLPDFSEPPTSSTEVLDLAADIPRWEEGPPMSFARRQHTATLLPDGSLLAVGGSSVRGFTNALGAVRHPERWDPDTRSWRTLAPMQEARLYHSTALLLPDGRVFVAGGGHPSDGENGDPDHFEAEIYSPPYLFAGPRPLLTDAPKAVTYGEFFSLESPDSAGITGVSLLRLGSVTHGFDQNQRFVPLAFANVRGLLRARAPLAPELAPPGDYLLFILRSGVPSVGHLLRIG